MFERSLSKILSDFTDSSYNFKKRETLPTNIKCSTSMITEMLKSVTKAKISLPGTFLL